MNLGWLFEVKNIQDYFGPAVLSGTFDGSTVSLPMVGLSVAAPIGAPTPAPCSPTFNTFRRVVQAVRGAG
jgi:hypothetical protein